MLTELKESGSKHRTFVYAGGQVLATQEILGISSYQQVTWEHRDPSNASYRTTQAPGNVFDYAELDPGGANAGLAAPLIPPHEVNEGTGSLLPFPSFSNPSRPGVGYSVDGIPVTTEYFSQQLDTVTHGSTLVAAEISARASSRVVGYRNSGVRWGRRFEVNYNANGQLTSHFEWGFDRSLSGVSYGNVSAVYGSSSWSQLASLLGPPQRPGRVPLTGDALADYTKKRDRLLELLKDKNSACAKYLLETVGVSGTRIARTVGAQRPFDGNATAISMEEAGLLPPRSYDMIEGVLVQSSSRVNIFFATGLGAAAAARYARASTGATANDVYFRTFTDSKGADTIWASEYTILHEALHTLLGTDGDDDKLNARGADVTSLMRAGCNGQGEPSR